VILLALDSAGASASVALLDAARPRSPDLLAARTVSARGNHADRLIELVEAVLGEARLGHGAIEVIAVNRGPGSFTGVRSAVAAARGLALAAGRPVVGVTGLEALAVAATAPPGAVVLAALDARRDQIYAQAFAADRTALGAAMVTAPEAALGGLGGAPVHLVGSGARAVLTRARRRDGLSEQVLEVDAVAIGRRAAACLADGERPVVGFALEPLYLRPPDARPAPPPFAAPARILAGA
jgi:tRNA threonylcarbamoyladenosine biosynthesis protein TsaB